MKLKVAVLGLSFICLIACTQLVSAAEPTGTTPEPAKDTFLTQIPSSYTLEQPLGAKTEVANIGEYINIVYRYALGIVGILATVLMMVGGLIWLSSAGNEQLITQGKEIITSAVVGLVIALFSYSILYWINPRFLSLDMAVFKIPIPEPTVEDTNCTTDRPLVEKSGLRTCPVASNMLPLPAGAQSSYTKDELNAWITKYVEKFNSGISLTLMKGIVKHESSYCINAHNPDPQSNACGLMGTLPGVLWTKRTDASGQPAVADSQQILSICGEAAGHPFDPAGGTDWQRICNYLTTYPEVGVCGGVNIFAGFANGLHSTDSRMILGAYHCGWNIWKPSLNCGDNVLSYYCPADYPKRCHSENPQKSGNEFLQYRDQICQANGGCSAVSVTTKSGTLTVDGHGYCAGKDGSTSVYGYAACNGNNSICPVAAAAMSYKNDITCATGTQLQFSESDHYGKEPDLYTSAPKCQTP